MTDSKYFTTTKKGRPVLTEIISKCMRASCRPKFTSSLSLSLSLPHVHTLSLPPSILWYVLMCTHTGELAELKADLQSDKKEKKKEAVKKIIASMTVGKDVR